jgi:hypothetical protein
VRTSPWRTFVTHDDPEYDNFGGVENPIRILVDVVSEKRAWLLTDGWMVAGVKACNFNTFFNT